MCIPDTYCAVLAGGGGGGGGGGGVIYKGEIWERNRDGGVCMWVGDGEV